jgi:hypothetical protein
MSDRFMNAVQGSDGSGLKAGLLLAAAAALPQATADLPDVSWSSVPRRALLQNDSHRAVNTTNQLIVLAGATSSLTCVYAPLQRDAALAPALCFVCSKCEYFCTVQSAGFSDRFPPTLQVCCQAS